ncbi:MAG: hypothetical protein BWY80_00405 [Firmicutes bacterium ADurb.Bin456]|nr:MAG: hypothetical protein BWY80_00405 [Firmicutes bacterium ADurb.Bin456]
MAFVGHRYDQSDGIRGVFSVNQVSDLHHIRLVFHDPVKSAQTGIKDTVINITGYFLGTHQDHFQLGIIYRREVGPAAHREVKAGLFE